MMGADFPGWRWVAWAGLFALAGICWLPASVLAHGQGPPLAFYGGEVFGADAGRCQRTIARAAGICFVGLARAHLQCATADLEGRGCDSLALAAKEQVLQQRSRELIGRGCTVAQTTRLGFGSLEEVQADVGRSCSEQARATTSLIFGPAMLAGEVKGTGYGRDACVLAAARHAFKLARAAVRERSLALGRVASSVMDVPGKVAAMAEADRAVWAVRQRAAMTLTVACGDQFSAAYRMPLNTFLERLSARGDCLVADSFVVDAVRCPTPVCGNGVQEPIEECDDANLLDTDFCDASCRWTIGQPASGETMGRARTPSG